VTILILVTQMIAVSDMEVDMAVDVRSRTVKVELLWRMREVRLR